MDRILQEALACGGDPLHLASVFGLDTKTASRYAENAKALLANTAEQRAAQTAPPENHSADGPAGA